MIYIDGFILGKLRLHIKFLLFTSSYTPLFIFLGIRVSFDSNDNLILLKDSIVLSSLLLLLIWILISNLILILLIYKRKKGDNPRNIKIKEKEDFNYIYVEYLFTYIIPFIDFNYNSTVDLFLILLLLLIVFYIFNRSNLMYINLIINLIGYNIFKIIDDNDNTYILLTRQEKLLIGEELEINSINDNLVVQFGG